MTATGIFPGGKRFAFTVLDDTDVATVENVTPIYRLLESLGMRTTKTVWPVACPEGSAAFSSSQTMEDRPYRDFVIDLQKRGFEIAFHGATMETSPRERILTALARFEDAFGSPPRVHANHSWNRENLYWGEHRVDIGFLRLFYRYALAEPRGHYQGHVRNSPYWWGDVAQERIEYMRNLTFHDINLLRINPSMPYTDARRPYGRWWFSSVHADNVHEFVELLSDANQERLEAEGGVCIVATHFGKDYCAGGAVHPAARRRLERLAARAGWFVPVSAVLDFLRSRRTDSALPGNEWRRMQWKWFRDLVSRHVSQRLGRPAGKPS